MTRPDITTLPASDLDLFLFAGIGTQTNGDELTVLSLLARLGSDPWVEAASLALLPQQAATDWLAERFVTMPLSPQAVSGARDTAARLLVLPPARNSVQRTVAGAKKELLKPRCGCSARWRQPRSSAPWYHLELPDRRAAWPDDPGRAVNRQSAVPRHASAYR